MWLSLLWLLGHLKSSKVQITGLCDVWNSSLLCNHWLQTCYLAAGGNVEKIPEVHCSRLCKWDDPYYFHKLNCNDQIHCSCLHANREGWWRGLSLELLSFIPSIQDPVSPLQFPFISCFFSVFVHVFCVVPCWCVLCLYCLCVLCSL